MDLFRSACRAFFFRGPRWAAGVLCAGGLLAAAAGAADHFTHWRTPQGLPSNRVTSLAQTTDGYLWLGTLEGLVRFDGVTFTTFDGSNVSEIHDSSVNCLYAAPDGTLWIGHPSGAVTSLRGGVFRRYPPRPDWKAGIVRGIAQDETGDIWIWDDAGELARLRDGKVLRPVPGSSPGLRQISASPRGVIWITSRGRLSVLRGGELQTVALDPQMRAYVQGVCASRDESVWVVAQGQLWKWAAGQWSGPHGTLAVTGQSPLHGFIELKDGRLAAGTSDHGAVIIEPEPFKETVHWRETGFVSDWAMAVAEDHEGGLWIGTGGAGLVRTRREAVEMLVPPDAWQGRSVLGVTPAQGGGIWVGTEGGGLYRWDGVAWTNLGRPAGILNAYVWAVTEDRDGRLWFGTSGGGLYRADGAGYAVRPGFDNVAPPMRAILAARDGGVWVGSLRGLVRYRDNAPEWVADPSGRALRDVRAVLEEPDGTVWAGSYGDGLVAVKDGKFRRYTRADGLGSDFVHALYRDAAGTLWIGTRVGLSRLKDGHIATLGPAQGLVDNFIGHIAEDGHGNLWMSSHGGIMRVPRADLEACADGRRARVDCLVYGTGDGLTTLACSVGLQPAGCTLADGRLAFSTDVGIAVIDPAALKPNPRPAPVVIEQVQAGEQVIAHGSLAGGAARAAAGTTRIEIKYTGLSFEAPEKVRFRYQLEGLETGWVEAGRERLAVYNHVPPGEYVFRVLASNNDNVWTETPASLRLVVLPHFWETGWFKAAGLFGLLSATAAAVTARARWRWQRALEASEREHAVELERSRIARDMHDDLGAHLTRITMLSETAKRDPAKARDGLEKIYDTARSVTRAMDEIVWAINPRHDTLESLVFYFEKFAQDFLGAAGIRCRLEMPAEFPAWAPGSEARHNLFLGLKEALNNAVRHSGADTVVVGLEMDSEQGRLFIRDNGRGGALPADGSRGPFPGGNGRANLEERLRRIGGRCEITSTPGAGTEVSLVFPLQPPRAAGRHP